MSRCLGGNVKVFKRLCQGVWGVMFEIKEIGPGDGPRQISDPDWWRPNIGLEGA